MVELSFNQTSKLDFYMHHEVHDYLFPEPVLFIHGNLASMRWWEPVLQVFRNSLPLKNATNPGITLDWRGCGKTAAPQTLEDLKPAKLASDCIALVEKIGLSKINIVGHSAGGLIALMALQQKPTLFNKALLIDPVSPDGLVVTEEKYQAFNHMRTNRSFCELVLATTVRGVNTKDPFFQLLVDDAFSAAELNWEGVPRVLTDIHFIRRLAEIPHEVLVLHGEFDVTLDIAEAKKIAEGLPRGRFEMLASHGHSLNVEAPQKLYGFMQDWFF